MVIVKENKGSVITPFKNKPLWGFVMLSESTVSYEAGFRREQKRSSFIRGLVSDLEKDGFYNGKVLPGKLIVKESLTPTNADDLNQDIKVAGDTKVICRQDDKPIYRTVVFTAKLDAQDELLAHTNAEEISNARVATKEVEAEF